MKKIIFMGIVMIFISIPVQATTITTEFRTSPSYSVGSGMGNMFDVNVLGSDLMVTGLDIHTSGETNGTVNLYTRSGSYLGHEKNVDGWNLIDSLGFTSAGFGNPTYIDIADFLLTGGITGFYITMSENSFPDTSMRYSIGAVGTTGDVAAFNDDLAIHVGISLLPGIGLSPTPFADSNRINYARTWNGSIHYELAPAVPEPSTFALMGLGVFGLFGVFRRRVKC